MIKNKVIIVGSGFSGLCMGIKLKEAGIHDFIILEKAPKLGGTWRENIYPGAECDIPSVLYSFSFATNPNWQRKWSGQEQILEYQQSLAERYQLASHFRFNQTVKSAKFDADLSIWTIHCDSGDQFQAQHFVSAIGQLHEVAQPNFAGLENYLGEHFHAAQWRNDISLNSKNVAVIGNAASAVQLIPEVAKVSKTLTVLQRSANWMLKKNNRANSKFMKRLYTLFPFAQKISRLFIWLNAELLLFPAIKGTPVANWVVKQMALANLRKHIKDPELRKTLTPTYPLGAKRTLFSHEYYEALSRDNVSLETTGVDSFTNGGIKLKDQRELKFDVVIFATGFQTNPFLQSIEIRGKNNILLKEHWNNGAHAYLGIHTHGFPNMHMLYGPNTNLSHNSIIAMIETQVGYIINAITKLESQQQNSLDIKESAESSYNSILQSRLNNMSFNKVAQSWYLDNGKITNNWAGNVTEYQKKLATIDWSAYKLN